MGNLVQAIDQFRSAAIMAEENTAPSTTKSCPFEQCDGSGWVFNNTHGTVAAECSCSKARRKQERIDRLFQMANIPKRYRDKTLKNFIQKRQPKAYRSAVRYVEKFMELRNENKNGMCLVGPTGTGKSHLVFAIINELISQSVSAVAGVVPDLLDSLRPKAAGVSRAEAEQRLELLKTTDLVLLDDLGSERGSEWAVERLYLILNARYIEQLPTLITTNLPLEALSVDENGKPILAWERIVSRIHEMCYVLIMDGDDFRRPALD